MPEGEGEDQEIESLYEKTIGRKSSFNVVKEIDFQEIQEAERVPKKLDSRNTPKHIIIKLPTIEDKERILKAAGGKETVTYKWGPLRLSASKRWLERNIQSHEKQRPPSKITLSSKAII